MYVLMFCCSFSGVVCGSLWKMHSLSQRRSSTLLPCPAPRISQAVSMAPRNPRAQPVPVGQKGCMYMCFERKIFYQSSAEIEFGRWAHNHQNKNINGSKFGGSVRDHHMYTYMQIRNLDLAVVKVDYQAAKFNSLSYFSSCTVVIFKVCTHILTSSRASPMRQR